MDIFGQYEPFVTRHLAVDYRCARQFSRTLEVQSLAAIVGVPRRGVREPTVECKGELNLYLPV